MEISPEQVVLTLPWTGAGPRITCVVSACWLHYECFLFSVLDSRCMLQVTQFLFFFPFHVTQIRNVMWVFRQKKSTWIQILSDENQASFICGTIVNVYTVKQKNLIFWIGIASHTILYTRTLKRACFFLLCLKMWIFLFCSTLLKPYKIDDEHTYTVSHQLTLFNFSSRISYL